MTDSAMKSPGKRVLLRCLLTLSCIVVLALGAAELLLRVIESPPPKRSESGMQFDPQLGWFHIPNAEYPHVTSNRTVAVKNNSIGLRERELADIAPDRILFLGDSFTFGFDAEVNERFSDLLQKELPQFGTVNAGVSGYGTDQQFLLMQRLWNDVKPKLVVLTFCVDNDRDDNTSSFRYEKYKPYFIRTRDGEWQVRGYPLPRPGREGAAHGVLTDHFAVVRFLMNTWSAILNREIIVPDRTEGLIDMVRRTVEAKGARFVVGLQRHEPRLEAYLKAQKIPYTTFEMAVGYSTAGWHWTPEGNAVVAKGYLALFAVSGVLTNSAPFSGDAPPLARDDAESFDNTSVSVFSPSFWLAASRIFPPETVSLARFVRNWITAVHDSHGEPRVVWTLGVLGVLAIAAFLLWFARQRKAAAVSASPGESRKAHFSLIVFLFYALTTPFITIVLLEAAEVRMIEVAYGFVAAIVIAAFGCAVALSLFAPDAPQRRLLEIDDATARILARHLVWATRALSILVLVLSVNTALAVPKVLEVAETMLFSIVIGAMLLHLLLSHHLRRAVQDRPRLRWQRAFGWLILAVIAAALGAGYPFLAILVASRLVAIAAVLGGLFLLRLLATEWFVSRIATETAAGHTLSTDVAGTRWLGLAAIVTGVGICLVVLQAAFVLYIGPWW